MPTFRETLRLTASPKNTAPKRDGRWRALTTPTHTILTIFSFFAPQFSKYTSRLDLCLSFINCSTTFYSHRDRSSSLRPSHFKTSPYTHLWNAYPITRILLIWRPKTTRQHMNSCNIVKIAPDATKIRLYLQPYCLLSFDKFCWYWKTMSSSSATFLAVRYYPPNLKAFSPLFSTKLG